MSNLKKQMIGALAWSSIDRFGQQAVQLVVSLLLARLLSPAEFGLIGMLLVFSALSYALIDGGLGQALIRKQDTSQADYSSVFYLNLGVSIVLYVALFFSAPLIADFFRQPLLVPIARVVLLGVIFNSLYIVPFVLMQKELDFKRLAKINILSVTLSGILGVWLAVASFGVWALVAQQLGFHFFRMIFSWLFRSWKPVWLFSLNALKSLWAFSVHLLGVSLLNVLFNNIYVVLLGRLYPLQQVGYFTQANKLSETANFTMQSVLNNGIFPVLSKIQAETERFARVFGELSKTLSLLAFPLMLFLIAIAEPLILLLLTEKWAPAIPYFQLLCLANLFAPLYTLNVNSLNIRGKSALTLRLEFVKKTLIVCSLFLFPLGIKLMLGGYALACAVAFFASIFLLKKELHITIFQQIKPFFPALMVGILVALVAFSLSFFIENKNYLLCSQVIAGGFFYVSLIYFCFRFYFDKTISFLESRFN